MPEVPRPVKMCVCFDTTFRSLLEAGVHSLDEIVERFGCTSGCGLCRPYIVRMLETGETEFAVNLEEL
jgi:NAD(P)H-nitrite reductase large subunit